MVLTTRSSPVFSFFTVTVASARKFPVLSMTLPVSEASMLCANVVDGVAMRAAAQARATIQRETWFVMAVKVSSGSDRRVTRLLIPRKQGPAADVTSA